jgi:hypothetical protein
MAARRTTMRIARAKTPSTVAKMPTIRLAHDAVRIIGGEEAFVGCR